MKTVKIKSDAFKGLDHLNGKTCKVKNDPDGNPIRGTGGTIKCQLADGTGDVYLEDGQYDVIE